MHTHNVTVYATDEAGNTNLSETLFLNVKAPEPFLLSQWLLLLSLSVRLGCWLSVYFRERRRRNLVLCVFFVFLLRES